MEYQEFQIEYQPRYAPLQTGASPKFLSREKLEPILKILPGFLAGAVVGAVATYYLDPHRGRYRRSLVRDKFVRAKHDLTWYGDKRAKNISNQVIGLIHEIGALMRPQRPVSDEKLVQRIRSYIGRELTHPRAVHITAQNGRVTLTGHILSKEVESVVECVKKISGVKYLDNQLEVHRHPGNIPDLQGAGKPYLHH